MPTPTKGDLKPRWPLSMRHMKFSPPLSSVHGLMQVMIRTIQCPSRVDTHLRVGSVGIRLHRFSNKMEVVKDSPVDKGDLSSSTLATKDDSSCIRVMMYFNYLEAIIYLFLGTTVPYCIRQLQHRNLDLEPNI